MILSELLTAYASAAASKKLAEERMGGIRADVEEQMRRYYDETGTLPSAKVPDVCSARLQGGEPEVIISDAEAFANWCAESEEFADAVTFVVKIPRKRVDSDEFAALWAKLQLLAESTSSEVASYVLDTLKAEGHADVESHRLTTPPKAVEGTGEVVPGEPVGGVSVHKTAPGLWITPVRPK